MRKYFADPRRRTLAIIDEIAELAGSVERDVQQFDAPPGLERGVVFVEQGHGAANRRQRRANLVRDDRHQRAVGAGCRPSLIGVDALAIREQPRPSCGGETDPDRAREGVAARASSETETQGEAAHDGSVNRAASPTSHVAMLPFHGY